VQFFFDESGDFGFAPGRYDAYTQAVVICPDSKLDGLADWVAAKRREWNVGELHAADLDDDQIFEVCRFVRSQRLPLLVQATDTNAVNKQTIAAQRLNQAVRTHQNAERWKAAGGSAATIERWYDRQVSRAAFSGRMSDTEWVQAEMLINLIHSALNKAIVVFRGDEWGEDFRDFRFVFDAKLVGKLADGEKYLRDVLVPALGSNPSRFSLIGVTEWRDPPVHPFEETYGTVEGHVDLKRLFARGLAFLPSPDHAGLQLADAVAYVTRRRVLEPENETVRWSFQTLRPLLMTHEGHPLYLFRFASGGATADESRFQAL
jgi:hypothetical protein